MRFQVGKPLFQTFNVGFFGLRLHHSVPIDRSHGRLPAGNLGYVTVGITKPDAGQAWRGHVTFNFALATKRANHLSSSSAHGETFICGASWTKKVGRLMSRDIAGFSVGVSAWGASPRPNSIESFYCARLTGRNAIDAVCGVAARDFLDLFIVRDFAFIFPRIVLVGNGMAASWPEALHSCSRRWCPRTSWYISVAL